MVEIKPTRVKYLLIEVTGRCNLNCVYCYNSEFNSEEYTKQELSSEKILELIKQAKELDFNLIAFSGGEPFLRKDLLDIVKKSALPVSILTNGTITTSEDIDNLREIKHFRELRFSLDGINSNNQNRGAGYSKRIIESINQAYDSGLKISINTMVTKYNVDDLTNIYELINEKFEAITWRIDLPFRSGRFQQNYEEFEVSFDKLFRQYKILISRYIKEKPNFRMEISNIFKPRMLRQGFYLHTKDQHPCDYALGCATIRPNGDVSFCPSLNLTFGNVKKDKLKNILHNKKFKKFCNMKVEDVKECLDCKYFVICGTGCRADALYINNDLYSKDQQSCKTIEGFHKHVLPLFSEKLQKEFEESLI